MFTDLLQRVDSHVDLADIVTNHLIVLLNTQLQKMVVDESQSHVTSHLPCGPGYLDQVSRGGCDKVFFGILHGAEVRVKLGGLAFKIWTGEENITQQNKTVRSHFYGGNEKEWKRQTHLTSAEAEGDRWNAGEGYEWIGRACHLQGLQSVTSKQAQSEKAPLQKHDKMLLFC